VAAAKRNPTEFEELFGRFTGHAIVAIALIAVAWMSIAYLNGQAHRRHDYDRMTVKVAGCTKLPEPAQIEHCIQGMK
jgi:hypothetical protein